MHRIPRFFIHRDKRKGMESKQKRRGPKLERRNAVKNIDYEPTTSPSPFPSDESSSALRTRSLDILPLGDRTSFRVDGVDGELDRICRSLGLSGAEDFAIPADAWEAMKVRSSSDLLPRSRLRRLYSTEVDTLPSQVEDEGASELSDRLADSVRVSDVVTKEQGESIEFNDCCTTSRSGVCELSDKLGDSVRVGDVSENQNDSAESVGCPFIVESSRDGGGAGIRGVRPPVLAPPPTISLPFIDNACSTWDLLRSFAPDSDGGSSFVIHGEFSSDDEDIMKGEEISRVRQGESAVFSSCSFTTSNDDDSSSTTTEPTSNISPNGRFRRNITYWEKGELLGRGSFGSVYEGIADDGFFFAVKQVSLLDQGDQGRQSIYQLEQEIALLSQFEHENIVQYYGTDKDESNLYIFLELVTKGSLLSLYQKYHLRDSQVSAYTRQILHGLKYLHERNVVHRDIKCANILVDASGSVKLADFGLAKATKLNDVKSCKGTAFWMAPEVVNRRNQGYGLAADIWSLGCTVLEMLTRRIPYSHLECMQALFRIGRGEPPPVSDSLSRDARDFILKCLQVNPNARPTAAQLLDHPFVKRSLSTSSDSASPLNPGRRV
uniref:mitogen-activated protein kinase kinase kinase n=1 Tax=Davidia involucrata TaxID=16924 RepID=A0A5B6YPW4_DAVIN